MQLECHVAVAGWSIRQEQKRLFAADGSHLRRYASRFAAVEINSSFYRSHRRETYQRWADSVPDGFRFSVKAPKLLTHEHGLENTGDALRAFLGEIAGLGEKLGCVLVQLPPSLAYDPRAVESFFTALRRRYHGAAACEPRHPTWFTGAADRRLDAHGVARVAADPSCGDGGDEPSASPRIAYFRLHGSPVMYYSSYDARYLDRIAVRMLAHSRHRPTWCVFDNTARGAATLNAIELSERLDLGPSCARGRKRSAISSVAFRLCRRRPSP
jgi:uncharacterized protein YecE (DUF72 family)